MHKKKKPKFNFMWLLLPLGPLFLIIVGLTAVVKTGKLKYAISHFDACKNEETAILLYNELITTSGLHKFFFKAASSNIHPIPVREWVNVFNNKVNPCPNVTPETKKDIKYMLGRFTPELAIYILKLKALLIQSHQVILLFVRFL